MKLEHTTEIAWKDEELEKERKLKDRKIAANEKQFKKKLSAAAKANEKEAAALRQQLQVSEPRHLRTRPATESACSDHAPYAWDVTPPHHDVLPLEITSGVRA